MTSPPTPREDNIGLDVAECLMERCSFAEDPEALAGRFVLETDSQHAAVIDFDPWDETHVGGRSANVSFAVARRDINELRRDLLFPEASLLVGSVRETEARFFDQPRGSWRWDRDGLLTSVQDPNIAHTTTLLTDFAEVEAWIDTWVPRLIEEATSLPWIRGWLDHDPVFATGDDERDTRFRYFHDQSLLWPRILNRMLDGWTEADDTRFLEPMRATAAALAKQHGLDTVRDPKREAIEAWVTANPNGITRELAD